MKQFMSALCVVALIFAPFPPLVYAQQLNQAAATLTTSSTGCATANSCVVLPLGPTDSSASIQINGTFAGTETFEASASAGSQWTSISCPTWAQGASVSSATATGAWTCDVAGKTTLRVRQSAYTSGGPTVSLASSPALASIASVQTPQSLSTTSTPTFVAVNQTGQSQFNGISRLANVAADFLTSGVGTNFEPITGLSWTLPANTALSVPWGCTVTYSQGTGNAAVSFGIGFTAAPTNAAGSGIIQTNTTTFAGLGMTAITTATSGAVVTGTPAATASLFYASFGGYIENPSTTANVVTINVKTATAADGITVKRGSYCALDF